MKAKDLAEKLLEFPDFEVVFKFADDNGNGFCGSPEYRSFDNIVVSDRSYASQQVIITGDE